MPSKTTIIILSLIILSFIAGIYYYQILPEEIASHWNSKGEVDGFMNKTLGIFLIPILTLIFFLIFILVPQIDPLRKNIAKFRNHYNTFILVFMIFMFYVYLLTLSWNLGYRFNMSLMILPALTLFFIYIGFLLEKTKRNWFIGIRTPWTLSSDIVWDKTHKLGGLLFKISGAIILFGAFFQKYLTWFIVIPIIISTIFLLIYSYVIYERLKKNPKNKKKNL
ncbi:SdpI family protein [archaeon]|jgi:uncharacterized membrane protein|nr:SdpI family protein [archaeon]MBT4241551.1 SdpI family protein [archaeon]MBT4417577.1 SdpI family protein [archaeon]